MPQFRKRVYEWLEPGEQGHALEHAFDYLLIFMILSSVLVVVLESMPEMAGHLGLLMGVEQWLVYFFGAEYLLRLWTCPESGKYGDGWQARLRYALSGMALVDLAAIAPYFLLPMVSSDAVVMRLLRIFRLVRVLKFGRYHASIGILGRVLRLRSRCCWGWGCLQFRRGCWRADLRRSWQGRSGGRNVRSVPIAMGNCEAARIARGLPQITVRVGSLSARP